MIQTSLAPSPFGDIPSGYLMRGRTVTVTLSIVTHQPAEVAVTI